MTSTILANFLTPRDEREDGFTLIEILVVIIIIGILAAVAIPIFLNQQRTARDSATTSDVRNLATNVETGLVASPEAKDFGLYAAETGGEKLAAAATEDLETLWVGVQGANRIQVSKTSGTQLAIAPVTGVGGAYTIEGWNEDGQEYTDAGADARLYDSTKGGITDPVAAPAGG